MPLDASLRRRSRSAGWAVAALSPAASRLSPAQPAALAQLQGQPARLLEPVDLPRPFRPQPVRRVHRQRQADRRPLQGRNPVPGARRLPGVEVRRLSRRHRLQGSGDPRRDQQQRLGLWPPIRYSYDTINKDYPRVKGRDGPVPGLSRPAALGHQRARCATLLPEQLARYPGARQPQLARHRRPGPRRGRAYHLRLSHLGAVRPAADDLLRHRRRRQPARCRAISAARVDLVFQRFLEIWSSIPSLFVLIIISSVLVPGFWTLLGMLLLFHWVNLVGVVRAEFLRGRNFEYITAARALGLSNVKIMCKHLLPNAMVATLTFLPFKLSGSITALTALDFLGPRPAARIAVAGRAAGAGQGQPAGAMARPCRLLLDCRPAVAADLHRRGGARRPRPAQDIPMIERSHRRSAQIPLIDVAQPVASSFAPAQHRVAPTRSKARLLQHRQGRDRGSGRRVGLAARPSRPSRSCACCPIPPRTIPTGEICFEGNDLLKVPEATMREIRGDEISIIFQEPMTSLNPLHTIEKQVGEVLKLHRGLDEPRPRAPRPRAPAQGRHPRSREAAGSLPAPALGRPAPARHDRHGARQRARPADRRRADHRARRHHPGADPRAAEARCSARWAWPCCSSPTTSASCARWPIASTS